MTILLKLDGKSSQGKMQDFTVPFQNFELDRSTDYEIAMIRAQIWYSWHNITAGKGNNILSISMDSGSTWNQITIPNGMWSISLLNEFIKTEVIELGGDEDMLDIVGNLATLKVDIELGANYQIDLSQGSLHLLLGFTPAIYTTSTSGTLPVDITAGINSILIHCSLATGSYINSNQSDIIYSFSPDVGPGNLLDIHPTTPIYLPLSTNNQITNINMRVTDQNNNLIDLNDENVSYLLHIRKVV